MFSRLILLLFLMFGLFQDTHSQTSKNSPLKFEITVIDGVEKYLELMQYPAYLVVALENNGIAASGSGRLKLVSESKVQSVGHFLFYFSKKDDNVYFYNAVLEWDTPIKRFTFDVPIQVNTAAIAKRVISVSFDIPMAEVFPDQLTNRIREKIVSLTNPNIQKLILDNLDEIMKKQGLDGSISNLKYQLMFQAYNRQIERVSAEPATIREPGDSVPLSDQVYFFGTLGIWLISPLIILGLYKSRKYRWNKSRKVD